MRPCGIDPYYRFRVRPAPTIEIVGLLNDCIIRNIHPDGIYHFKAKFDKDWLADLVAVAAEADEYD